jgi:hypothetical protein
MTAVKLYVVVDGEGGAGGGAGGVRRGADADLHSVLASVADALYEGTRFCLCRKRRVLFMVLVLCGVNKRIAPLPFLHGCW